MEPNWLKFVILFGILQSALVIFLIGVKKRAFSHFTLTAILTILLISQIEAFLLRTNQFQWFVHFTNMSAPLIFLLGPSLYLYIKNQLGEKQSLYISALHTLPFLVYLLYSFNFYLQPYAIKYNAVVMGFHPDADMLAAVQSFPFDPWNIQGIVVVELFTLHLIAYCILSFLIIRKHKRQRSKRERKKKEWLLYITAIMTAGALIMFFSQGGVINGKVFLESPFPSYSADISSSIAMYFLMIYFLIRPEMYRIKVNKYQNSTLSSSFKKVKLKQLRAIIESEKLYLDSEFSLKSLSQKSGLSPHHISQILNEELKLNFFELTNEYRIREAKDRLRNENESGKMEQLAYELGYKSKSTFFSAFKKHTNLTPLMYKKNHA